MTTSRDRGEDLETRAREVAARCGVPFVRRRALGALFEREGADVIYVVGRKREELVDREGRQVFVHAGMTASKLREGRRHPFVRAVAPGEEEISTLFDATLGLASDALHLAAATGARVVGAEASLVVCSLLEEGLFRLAAQTGEVWAEAAARIEVRAGSHEAQLAASADDAFDVVLFDPMLEHPQKAAPGFALFRRFAEGAPVSAVALEHARRVARRRVVLKVRSGWRTVPDALPWHRRIGGKANDLLVHDVAG